MELIKIIKADYIKDYKIEITFNDGLKKEIDFKEEALGRSV